ncbi:DMT family transporter [Patescibacteria group bacterium]|nr:DMT family transporter [Patescibacteria group bacterium]
MTRKTKNPTRSSGYVFVLSAVSIWAVSSGILVKLISVSAFTLYAVGAFWAILFLLIALAAKRKLVDLLSYPRKTLWLMLAVGLGVAINNGLFFTAIKTGTVANAVLTHYLAPLLVVLVFGPVILKEKITSRRIVLSAVGFLGLFVLIYPDLGRSVDPALIYGTLSAIFFAFHTSLEKMVTQTKIDSLSAVVYKNIVPLVVFLPFAIRSISAGISPDNWFWMTIWGILVLGVSFILYFQGIKRISAASASNLSYGEPIGAIALAAIFFREPVSLYTIIGGLLIIASGIGVVRARS